MLTNHVVTSLLSRAIRRSRLSRTVMLFGLFAALAGPWVRPDRAQAAEDAYSWTGEGDNNSWIDACNWWPADACESDYPGKDDLDDRAFLGELAIHVHGGGLITLKDLTLDEGAQLLSGIFTVSDAFNWIDGLIGAKITIANGGNMRVSTSDGEHFLTDFPGVGQIDVYGSADLVDAGEIFFMGDTTINNFGTFHVNGGTTLTGGSCCVPPTSNFNNYGSLIVHGTFLPFTPNQVTLSGLSMVHFGTIEVSEGVTFTLGHGNHALHHGSLFKGDGRTVIAELSGDPAITGTAVIDRGAVLELNSNNFGGTGAFAGEGTFNWTGGEIVGRLTVAPSTTLHLSGPADKRLVRSSGQGGELTTHGPVTWAAGGRIFFTSAAIFNNHGTFDGGSAPIFEAGSCCTPPVSTFNNFGAFGVHSATASFKGVFVNNQGTFSVTNSTLGILSGARYSQTAGITHLDGAAITATAGFYIDGGLLEGTGVITGPVHNRGQVHPGLSPGALRIAGSYVQYQTGTLFIEIAGDTPVTDFDQLQVTGAATFSGTLSVSRPLNYEPPEDLAFPIVVFGSHSGNFSSLRGFAIGNGKYFTPVFHAGSLTLLAVRPLYLPHVIY
jgi:hypothetical protein